MTTSLVTGGAGFIGSHVVDHLIKMGHKVVVLDDLSGGCLENLTIGTLLDGDLMPIGVNPASEGVIMVAGSILDAHCIDNIFSVYKPDYVFHLAAYAAEGLSHFARRFIYTNNVIGSVNLINAVVNYGVKRFVFTSSAAVYGRQQSPLREGMFLMPIDPYGIAKMTVEQDLQAAYDMFGLHYTIFRLHNVYGPRQNLNDGYRNVVGIFMRQCLRGEPMTIFGDGSQIRAFSYIDDVAPYIAQSIEKNAANNEIINIGGDMKCTINTLSRFVSSALGIERENVVYLPERYESACVVVGHEKADRIFGATQKMAIASGVKRMADWAKTQTLRDPEPFADIEINKFLPESWRKLHVNR